MLNRRIIFLLFPGFTYVLYQQKPWSTKDSLTHANCGSTTMTLPTQITWLAFALYTQGKHQSICQLESQETIVCRLGFRRTLFQVGNAPIPIDFWLTMVRSIPSGAMWIWWRPGRELCPTLCWGMTSQNSTLWSNPTCPIQAVLTMSLNFLSCAETGPCQRLWWQWYPRPGKMILSCRITKKTFTGGPVVPWNLGKSNSVKQIKKAFIDLLLGIVGLDLLYLHSAMAAI